MKIHELKCISPYFEQVFSEKKTFEIRKNDRDFKVGDVLHLRHFTPEHKKSVYIPIPGFDGVEVQYVTEKKLIPGEFTTWHHTLKVFDFLVKVTYITNFPDALKEGYVVLGIEKINT